MFTLLTAAALAAAPAPQPMPAAQAPKTEAPCDMPCCKDKPMPCCAKMMGKKAEAPAVEASGGHEHDH